MRKVELGYQRPRLQRETTTDKRFQLKQFEGNLSAVTAHSSRSARQSEWIQHYSEKAAKSVLCTYLALDCVVDSAMIVNGEDVQFLYQSKKLSL
ncbi:hypothetical protein J6590_053370 [Homalodisca vitripennis]|nr:hypothetical protein J6590_053370 [Homalodisca vitripennis]